jgi:hypothetical protein
MLTSSGSDGNRDGNVGNQPLPRAHVASRPHSGNDPDVDVCHTFEATGMRLSELAGIRYDPLDAERSDLDLWQREVAVRGKNGKQRIVKISYPAARTVDPVHSRPVPARPILAATAVAGGQ